MPLAWPMSQPFDNIADYYGEKIGTKVQKICLIFNHILFEYKFLVYH